MWFDGKCQIGTFSGNLSMPQMEHPKDSLHTCWITQKLEKTETPASLNATLTRKHNRLACLCVSSKFPTVSELSKVDQKGSCQKDMFTFTKNIILFIHQQLLGVQVLHLGDGSQRCSRHVAPAASLAPEAVSLPQVA